MNTNLTAVITDVTNALAAARTFNDGPVAGLPVATAVVDTDQINSPLDVANLTALTRNADLPTYAPHIQTALDTVQRFDSNDDLLHTNDDNAIDLVSFVIELQRALVAAGFDQETNPLFADTLSEALIDTLANFVVQHARTQGVTSTYLLDVSDSNGVSIFFPRQASHFYDAANYQFAAGAIWNSGAFARQRNRLSGETAAWGQLLVNFFELTDPGGPVVSDLPQPSAAASLPPRFDDRPLFADDFESSN